ncbi:SAM-dependent methyltransferase [Leucobacter exalbidus]|uniref:SAM-dependent methyltransferase n=1 Tax=Leucobacter exalbidus TaxID=662960 RepID=A0A940PU87_9MICO|nr:class I SAM-dependent methyltransferase [Leucobacter exalbidus]MBP1325326.1 SAM-dependent methyltransferase [Leucobacter exalbidus]
MTQPSSTVNAPEVTPAEIKRVVTGYWHTNAHRYDLAPEHVVTDEVFMERWLQLLAPHLPQAQGARVLDVGCGTGFLSQLTAKLGHHTTGLDFSESMLQIAKGKAEAQGLDIDFVQGDADHLPFADGTFTALVERHVLWTMADPAATLREWLRVLSPGGVYLHIGGDWSNLQPATDTGRSPQEFSYSSIEHALRFPEGARPEEMVELFTEAGLIVRGITELPEASYWQTHHPEAPLRRYLIVAERPAADDEA